ncbi:uncharacterized protein LOC128625856 [Artibeus jamaicensis]|uniref:uncharacterized protein LOC128625856 n=1 Tax=Artibeus jamaicensis TaxID=9417 RepID=UPI00235AB0A8|nr:uncharacterized protein LOC128625856 [Artibeus jamaicensis]
MDQPRPLRLRLWKGEERSAQSVKTAEENLVIWDGGEKSASEPGLRNGNHMASRGAQSQIHPRSQQPVTSPAGPARRAAALSLRVREALCPPQGPRVPGPATLPPRRAVPNRCQPQRQPGHIWLRFAVILASPHHLTADKKKQQSKTSQASPPPPPTSPALAPRARPPRSTSRPGPVRSRAGRWGQGLRHIVRSCGSYLSLQARSGVGPSGAGAAPGEAQSAAATRPARTAASRERVASHGVRTEAAPRLGASSCSAAAAASSSQAASAGRLQRLGQHFPAVWHTLLRERDLWHKHTTTPRSHAPLEKLKIRESQRKGWRRQKPDRGAQTWESPRSRRRGRGGQTPAARGQLSLSREAPHRRPAAPAQLTSPAQTLRPGTRGGGGPSSHFGSRAEAEQWLLPHERLKARTRARGNGEVHGTATSRTRTEGRCPSTSPRNSPQGAQANSEEDYRQLSTKRGADNL